MTEKTTYKEHTIQLNEQDGRIHGVVYNPTRCGEWGIYATTGATREEVISKCQLYIDAAIDKVTRAPHQRIIDSGTRLLLKAYRNF